MLGRYNKLLKSRNELREKQRNSRLSVNEEKSLQLITEEYDQVYEKLTIKRNVDVALIRNIIDPYRQKGILYLGGVPMITVDMVTFIRNDLIVFGGGVLIFLIIVFTIITSN